MTIFAEAWLSLFSDAKSSVVNVSAGGVLRSDLDSTKSARKSGAKREATAEEEMCLSFTPRVDQEVPRTSNSRSPFLFTGVISNSM